MKSAISAAKLNAISEVVQILGSPQVVAGEVYKLEQTGQIMRGTLASIRKHAVVVRRGLYNVENILDQTSIPVQQTLVMKSEPLMQQPQDLKPQVSYIPSKDPSYVRFGFYNDLLQIIKSRVFAPVYITGETGNGKTMTVLQACAAQDRECIPVNITNETSEEDLIGSQTLKDGNLIWVDGPALIAMKRGAVLLLDELDQGTSRLLCLQTILQSHTYYVKKTGDMVEAAEGFQVIATGNTRGDGMGQDVYIGAQLMNEAFLDRFPITFQHVYPPASTERRILSKHGLEEGMINKLVEWATIARQTKDAGAIEHTITTRRLVQIASNFAIFNNVDKAIELAVARFDQKHSSALLDLWNKMKDDDSQPVSGNSETATYEY